MMNVISLHKIPCLKSCEYIFICNMIKTKHPNSLKRDKVYYFKYCDISKGGCGEKYKPDSGGCLCKKCIIRRRKERFKRWSEE